jgi:hypothetical protein
LKAVVNFNKFDQKAAASPESDLPPSIRFLCKSEKDQGFVPLTGAKKRGRERNAQAKAKGKSVSQKSRTRDGWHLMVTNVKSEIQSVEELCEIYRQRWQIEIVFRAWKQSSNLRSALNRVSSEQHLKGLMLAGILLMAMSLQMGMGLIRNHPGRRISLEKVFTYLMKKNPKNEDTGGTMGSGSNPGHPAITDSIPKT